MLYLADFHPAAMAAWEGEIAPDTFRFSFPFFPGDVPLYNDPGFTCTDGDAMTLTGCYEWAYIIGQVVTALCDAGLRIEFLHEHPCCVYPCLPGMHRGEDGLWWRETNALPLIFSIRARKDG